jgi:hypothetical protein
MVLVAWVERREDDGEPGCWTENYDVVGFDGSEPLIVAGGRLVRLDEARQSGCWGANARVVVLAQKTVTEYFHREAERRLDRMLKSAMRDYQFQQGSSRS